MLNRLYLVCPQFHQAQGLESPSLGNEIVQNEPVLPICELITFAHLVVPNRIAGFSGVGKNLREAEITPRYGKIADNPCLTGNNFQKGGTYEHVSRRESRMPNTPRIP